MIKTIKKILGKKSEPRLADILAPYAETVTQIDNLKVRNSQTVSNNHAQIAALESHNGELNDESTRAQKARDIFAGVSTLIK